MEFNYQAIMVLALMMGIVGPVLYFITVRPPPNSSDSESKFDVQIHKLNALKRGVPLGLLLGLLFIWLMSL